MTEQTETVMSEAITVADLPWGRNPLLTAGLSIQIVYVTKLERLQARLKGYVRRKFEVRLSTARKNGYSFVGYKKEADAVELVEMLATLSTSQLAQLFVELDKMDAGSRSAALLAQWREVCLAWTWDHFAPGDVVCLDGDTEVETVDGRAVLSALAPFVINDVLLEEDRTVLAMSSTGDVLQFDIDNITLLAPGLGSNVREVEVDYVYRPGQGYVRV